MKFYMNKDNEDNEDECYVLGITNREPNQHLCEFAKRFVSIEDENSNRGKYNFLKIIFNQKKRKGNYKLSHFKTHFSVHLAGFFL